MPRESDRSGLLAAAASASADIELVVAAEAEAEEDVAQPPSRAADEQPRAADEGAEGAPAPAPASDGPPTCYVCGSAEDKLLMLCENFAECGGAKHARCGGMVAVVAHWRCEPCKGRPRQGRGEPMDWAADREEYEAEQKAGGETLSFAGKMLGVGFCMSCTVQ